MNNERTEENRLEKKSDKKNRKNIAHVNKNHQREKANFCTNTVSSLYIKIRAKRYHAAKPLDFSLHFLFQRDQNNYSNLTSKS